MVKLVKIGEGTGTIIENDGITVSQSSNSDWQMITADTPFPSTSGKYVYEITIINETANSSYNIGASFSICTSNTSNKFSTVCENHQSKYSLFWWNSDDSINNRIVTGSLIIKEGDIVGVGWDLKNGKISFFINGKLVLYTDICFFDRFAGAAAIYPMIYFYPQYVLNVTAKVNFGQQKYTYSYGGFINLYDYKIGENFKLKLY